EGLSEPEALGLTVVGVRLEGTSAEGVSEVDVGLFVVGDGSSEVDVGLSELGVRLGDELDGVPVPVVWSGLFVGTELDADGLTELDEGAMLGLQVNLTCPSTSRSIGPS